METFRGFSEKITDILKEKYKDENVEISLQKDTGHLLIENNDHDIKEDYNLNDMYEEYRWLIAKKMIYEKCMVNIDEDEKLKEPYLQQLQQLDEELGEGNISLSKISSQPKHFAKAIQEGFDSLVNMARLDKTTGSEEDIDKDYKDLEYDIF